MPLEPVHELHTRRFGRNVGVGLVLGAFVVLIFGLTIAKVGGGDQMEGFDHAPRESLIPADPQATDGTAPAAGGTAP